MFNKYFTLICILTAFISCTSDTTEQNDSKQIKENKKEITNDHKISDSPNTFLPFKAPSIPNKVTFAGEEVPVDDQSIKERLDRELLINNFWHTRTFLTIKRSGRWFPLIEKILKENNVPDDFKYLAVAESGLENVISPANAVGYWQFLKNTALGYDIEVDNEVDERYNVEKSTHAACKYLIEAKNQLGSWTLAAAAYNRGKAGMKNQLDNQKVSNYYDLLLNEETARYLFRIIATKIIFENPDQYGFDIPEESKYKPYLTTAIQVDSTIEDITKWAIKNKSSYKLVKLLNPWIRAKKITINNNKTYSILIPSEKSTLQIHGE